MLDYFSGSNAHLVLLNSPVRKIQAKVELYNSSSSLVTTFDCRGALKSFTVERVGEEKFFGFGVCQKLSLQLRDVNRKFDITTDNSLYIYFYDDSNNLINPYPNFYVTEVNRDENTNELSITAYDALYFTSSHTVAEVEIEAPYSIDGFSDACLITMAKAGKYIGDTLWQNVTTYVEENYETGANFEGTETIREALDAIAEATQSVYYLDYGNDLIFKRLDVDGEAVYWHISKDRYFSLDSKTNRRLSTIVSATELGDNVSVTTGETGSTQYVRNNPFWELREDIDTLLEDAIAAIGGLTINQFECEWRGNYLFEIGDKIALVTKDDVTVYSYLLNDTVTYDGTLSEKTEWNYTEDEAETASNPATLGEALKQTYAKVDKANKEIEIVASEVGANSAEIASLQINTESISASVSQVETNTNNALEAVNSELETLTTRVNATMTSEEVLLEIQSELENGASKVTTKTGFTFDDEGLTVSKSDSEMSTQITEDGMTVYRNEEAVLIANNNGVEAVNLDASTYLIIGNNSRFEDYGEARTGCFWIGG